MDKPAPKPAPKSAPKKLHTLEDILNEFKTLDQVQFDPFKPEAHTKARANLPQSFLSLSQPHPLDYFNLFLTDDLWKTITTNSNRYAAFQQRTNPEERRRPWKNLIPEELRVFVGAAIYMGIHKEPQIEDYWNTDIKGGPLHTIPIHISLCRFEQIKRFLHISDAEEDIRTGRDCSDQWWYKLEPLASALQRSFAQFYTPSSEVSIDEIMVQCFGRSLHTYKMPNKPIQQGYKVFGLADHGYLYSFLWSSRVRGLQEIVLRPQLTPTGSLVRTLALTLPRRCITIYMDNYFTSVPLFEELRSCEFGAVGTTRPHPEFPPEMKELKDRFSKKLEWNTLLAKVVRNTLCLAWQDNNIVLALTNIHTVGKAKDWTKCVRKRPPKTSTNGALVYKAFGGQAKKELLIPSFINDYNHFMGGVDLANQFREAYELHRTTLRTWWPLFYWLIDVVCVNAYRLYVLYTTEHNLKTPLLSHRQFRTELYYKLLGYSVAVQQIQLQMTLPGQRAFGSDLPYLHVLVRMPRAACVWCFYKLKSNRILGIQDQKAPKKSYFGCQFCNVQLCKEGSCWGEFHLNNAN
jgi:hypothetical protein